ncbi:MAG TPA: FAD-dependent oxidoreductase [Actinocrinis sp.]|nr:FAD-dependent oxidoreductase [Actinocrinis sp.]
MSDQAFDADSDGETLQADVVVMGYGFAGATAAITAHDAGADVLILEKMPQAGGNSRVSGGNMVLPRPADEDAANLATYLKALSRGTTPDAVVETYVAESRDLVEWFAKIGGDLSIPEKLILADTYPRTIKGPGFPGVPGGAGTFDKYCLREPAELPPSLRLWQLLSQNVSQREIDVRVDAPVRRLLLDSSGAVEGVIAQIDGRPTRVLARSVVMACGGFENQPELTWDYITPQPFSFAGNPGNTGDGIRLAQQIGADLWHMTRTSCVIGFQAPEFEAAFGIFFPADGFLYTDGRGRRFVDETGIELHEFTRILCEPEGAAFPRIPTWAVFDERTRLAGPLTWNTSGYNRDLYSWSPDNSAEVERGWILRAESVRELAEATGLPADELGATLTGYNAACAEGRDPGFGRSAATLKPLEPPFYAIALRPAVLNTQGGARRDEHSRVLRPDGAPIPGLYSAGEFGSIWGYLYQGATNIGECIVSGRVAGRGAAEA